MRGVPYREVAIGDGFTAEDLKKATGGDTVRICEYTNYCEGLDQKHKPVTCQLWDKERLDEQGVALTPDRKRRMVAPDWVKP